MNKESIREGTLKRLKNRLCRLIIASRTKGIGKGKWKWERTYESTSGQEQTDQDQSESSNKKMLDNQSKKGGKKKFDKRKIQCYNYNKWGHFPY